MSRLAVLSAACVLGVIAACSNPTPPCSTPGQVECGTSCVFLASDLDNCGKCDNPCATGQACLAGQCSSITCDHPDLVATCWIGGGVVGICSDRGLQTPQAIVAIAPGDAGISAGAVVPEFQSAVFTGPSTLWLLDYQDNQIDVVDTSTWPPAPIIGISAGPSDEGYSVPQLAVCDGLVLALRTDTPLLEAYDLTPPFKLVNQVSLASDGGFQSLVGVACDGQHTAYVTDSANNTVTAVDLTSFQVTAQATLPAGDQIGALPDGGFISASLTAVAVETGASGATVLVAAQNLDTSYQPAADSTVFELNAGLTTWSPGIDPKAVAGGGVGCLNTFQMAVSADQSTAYLACAGVFDTAGATTVQPYNPTGDVGVITGQAAGTTLVTTLSNPASLAVLKNGLVAIGDYSPQSEVALYNPADGGIVYVPIDCPVQADGGLFPGQGITAVVAAP
jgi:hypothetical protein